MRRANAFVLMALGGMALAPPGNARAQQAWLPPKGEASLSLGYSYAFATEHVDYQGNPVSPGDMMWNNVATDISYGITDRFAVRVTPPPLVISKYQGSFPHPPVAGRTNLDDGAWHSTFQDFRGEVRFRLTRGSTAVTPFAGLIVPSHSYEYYGHPAAGRDLVEGQLGVVVGRLLDPILPNAYLQVRYLYGIPEKELGVSHNRSQLSFDLGYLIGSAFSARFLGTWQKSYGGWRVPVDWPPRTSTEFQAHDQLQRADYVQLGGAASYSLTSSVDVNVFAYGTVYARSYVDMKGLGLSLTYSASPAQLIRKKRGEKTSP